MAKEQASSAAALEATPGPAPTAQGRFRVSLACPTPIAHKSLVVEAATDEEARQAFMKANGISGSDAEWRVEPTDEPATDLSAKPKK